jgi:hypothetical protein
VSVERPIASDRLGVPREHLGVLVEPEASALHAAAGKDQTAALSSTKLLDTSVSELRAQLRGRLELSGPVILTGHQAGFDHAGVFAKTIAVEALAAHLGGTGVFLTVDSDLPKTTQMRVPFARRGQVRRGIVQIPGCDPELPVEWQPPVARSRWREFFDRIAELVAADDTLLPTYTEGFFDDPAKSLDLLAAIGRGQVRVGGLLGLKAARDISTSQLSRTPEFRAFVAHLMLRAEQFAHQYNQAQQAYRARHRVRSRRQPVPRLVIDGERVELPFWISQEGRARQRLLVADRGDHVVLFADYTSIGRESTARLSNAANLAEGFRFESKGWHLRPRALSLSAFTRLFVSDLFVHGIGGAKYDEMTQDFIRRFFGVDLPPACCVTATAYLPLPQFDVTPADLAAIRHARRDMHFNPQRHVPDLPRDLLQCRAGLIEQSKKLRNENRFDRAARRRTFQEIRSINHELLRCDMQRVMEFEKQWRRMEQHERSDRVARDRECFFALHPRRTMEELVERIRAAVT